MLFNNAVNSMLLTKSVPPRQHQPSHANTTLRHNCSAICRKFTNRISLRVTKITKTMRMRGISHTFYRYAPLRAVISALYQYNKVIYHNI